MVTNWLSNAESSTSWAHHAWPAFRDLPEKKRHLAVLPVFGLADHGLGLPLDIEETVGSAILHGAVASARDTIPFRVLPPLRFGLAPYPSTFFGIDPETAHDLVREIADSVKAAGFAKLVFFVTSPWQEEFVDAASRDTRVTLGLQTFVINLSGLGLDFHPKSESRARLQRIGSHLLDALPDSAAAADIADADFRPGRFFQPAPLAAGFTLTEAHDGGATDLSEASTHLARLFAEVDARAPLGSVAGSAAPVVAAPPLPAATTVAPSLWPSYRPRYLPALTRAKLEALEGERGDYLVIVPTGAIEQHGPHLPVGVDSILGQAWLGYALPHLPPDAKVLVAPPITFGKSNEHVGFPGTVFISARTLRRLLLAIARQLHALGFRKIGILNTHGGNSAVLVYTLREIQATLGLRAGMISSGYKPELSAQEAEFGFHAGEWETSLMMEVTDRVDPAKAVCEFPAHLDDPGELRPENAPAIFSWITSDISQSGVMGDATAASPAKGRVWMESAARALADQISRLAAN